MLSVEHSAAPRQKRSDRLRKSAPENELPRRTELARLFEKYDVQAPRYTSYPPATQFTSEFDSSNYLEHLSRVSLGAERPEISLYVHLPFCDTLCYFCGCSMMISNDRGKIAHYLGYLKREISMLREALENDPVVVQMHWGGGSPTHLLPSEIESLAQHIRSAFVFDADAECSIEIDPRGVTEEHVRAMQAAGFNRASIGVQDFNPDVQSAINRVQSRSLTEQVIAWCRQAGITDINLDLIYGLPYQTTETFLETLQSVIAINPDRLAVYSFAYVPWIKPHQNLIPIELLPVASTKLSVLELAIHELTEAGYEYLGMDHFAKPGDSLVEARQNGQLHRNFQGYSTHAGKDLFALGLSGISRVENAFAQNVKTLESYYGMIDEARLPIERGYELTTDDEIREYVIMRLMCDFKVDIEEVERLFDIDFPAYFAEALPELRGCEADGLVKLSRVENSEVRQVDVTPVGRFFLRNIATCFDAYLPQLTTHRRFSNAI